MVRAGGPGASVAIWASCSRSRLYSIRYMYVSPCKYIYDMYTGLMQDAFWEWEDDKAERNESEHGVTFREAQTVFQDPARVEFYDETHSEDEGRFAVIGFSNKGRMLFVVFTPRGERTRLISARIAERDEEDMYEQGSY
jgi:uncharacterized DUF497 family protein